MRDVKNILILLCLLTAGFLLCAPSAAAKPAKIKNSISSIIIDAKTGKLIESQNADELRYPASLTKIMTLYIAFDALDKGLIKMTDYFPVSRNAANRAPSKLGLRAGDKISVEEAIIALIVKSANDCATVLAEGLGYTEENFAQTMTNVAHELGMENTTFKNASGLPHREQKTTARDMALLAAAIYHHFPQYYHLFSIQEFAYQNQTLLTHNKILKSFEGADGLKTGFTHAAGYNIVTSAERDGQRVIAVTMGHRQLKARDKEVAKLMDKGLVQLASAHGETPPPADSNIFARLEKSPVRFAEKTADNDAYGIQIGAFSNYTKARNYALQVKSEIHKKFKNKNIDIEAVESNSAIVYRSKIIAFDEKSANEACNGLKKLNRTCIVVAVNKQPETTTAQLDEYQIAHNSNQQ